MAQAAASGATLVVLGDPCQAAAAIEGTPDMLPGSGDDITPGQLSHCELTWLTAVVELEEACGGQTES